MSNVICFCSLFEGLGGNVHAIYLGESSPKKIRGLVTLTASTFLSLGKLAGQFAGLR